MSGTCSISMLVYWRVLLVWCVYCHSIPGELMDSDPQSWIAQARSPPLFIRTPQETNAPKRNHGLVLDLFLIYSCWGSYARHLILGGRDYYQITTI